MAKDRLVLPLRRLGLSDSELVGGKSASLGEMIQTLSKKGVRVPGGFSTTALAYQKFLAENGLEERIAEIILHTNVKDSASLAKAGEAIRRLILAGKFSDAFVQGVTSELRVLVKSGVKSLAVRSSATAEDSPDASFAGQQETLLNIPAKIGPVLSALKRVIASLYGDRAIAYREEHKFEHAKVYLCACVQAMVRSDRAVAGVMFTVDSESGHRGVIEITAVWGLGETAVGGGKTDAYIVGKPTSKPDFFPVLHRSLGNQGQEMVFASNGSGADLGHYTKLRPTTEAQRARFCLSDKELQELAKFGRIIEKHYDCPMDIEWAKDGYDGKLYIVQARPVTVNKGSGCTIETFTLAAGDHKKIAEGLAVGQRIASGRVVVLKDASPAELAKVHEGDILVAEMTDPNYGPAMRLAAAIVTKEGSTKCHAAIIAREQGIPAVVACEEALTLTDGQQITVCCAEGAVGVLYEGLVPFEKKVLRIGNLPALKTKVKMNVGDPDRALQAAMLPNDGVGLARQEFIIANAIGIHPRACLEFPSMPPNIQKEILRRIVGFKDPVEYYVRKLAEGIARIAQAFWPHRVVIRLSDFKTNEYRELLGGSQFEPVEANPMIGFRGAARYLDPNFRRAFELECRALKIVRDQMGLINVDIMVPFVRTLAEARGVIKLLAKNGLVSSSGNHGLRIGMMCEVPNNVTLAHEYAQIFDFASIGSNDLTQLVLGIDRDSGYQFGGDERDLAVKREIERAISAWHNACKPSGKPIGICGQAPSDHKGYAEWLAEAGIDSMSLNPDTVINVHRRLARRERKLRAERAKNN